jgi:hypothetical protein
VSKIDIERGLDFSLICSFPLLMIRWSVKRVSPITLGHLSLYVSCKNRRVVLPSNPGRMMMEADRRLIIMIEYIADLSRPLPCFSVSMSLTRSLSFTFIQVAYDVPNYRRLYDDHDYIVHGHR